MQFKAHLADGTNHGAVILVPETVRRLIAWHCQTCPDRRSALSVKPGSLRDMLEAGVLRDVCAFESRDVSSVLVSSPNASEDRQESRLDLWRMSPTTARWTDATLAAPSRTISHRGVKSSRSWFAQPNCMKSSPRPRHAHEKDPMVK